MQGKSGATSEQHIALNFVAAQHPLSLTTDSSITKRTLHAALQLIAILQTTLDIEALLRLFSREVSSNVSHSGLTYELPAQGINLAIGRSARYRCHFELLAEKQVLGNLCFMRGNPFSQEDIAQLEYLLSALIYQLRNAMLYHSAMQATLTDPLTGAYNRNFSQKTLRREVGLAKRYQLPFSLLVLDIDRFKQVNDRYGHDVGDQMICAVANTISNTLRETDMLVRFGGDEFVVLLSNTPKSGAVRLAHKLRDAIAGSTYRIEGDSLRTRVSIGVASLLKSDTAQMIFCRADAALLEAKREGRNGIAIATADSYCNISRATMF